MQTSALCTATRTDSCLCPCRSTSWVGWRRSACWSRKEIVSECIWRRLRAPSPTSSWPRQPWRSATRSTTCPTQLPSTTLSVSTRLSSPIYSLRPPTWTLVSLMSLRIWLFCLHSYELISKISVFKVYFTPNEVPVIVWIHGIICTMTFQYGHMRMRKLVSSLIQLPLIIQRSVFDN